MRYCCWCGKELPGKIGQCEHHLVNRIKWHQEAVNNSEEYCKKWYFTDDPEYNKQYLDWYRSTSKDIIVDLKAKRKKWYGKNKGE